MSLSEGKVSTQKCVNPSRHFVIHFQEHLDYELVQSTNPEFNKAVVRVNVFKEHRQTIQVTYWWREDLECEQNISRIDLHC